MNLRDTLCTVAASSGLLVLAACGSGAPQAVPALSGANSAVTPEEKSVPSTLPITISSDCTTLTLAPNSGETFSRLRFEETARGKHGSRIRYDGAFDAAHGFGILGMGARVRVRLFDDGGRRVLDLRGTVSGLTASSQSTPCPSASPTAEPTEEPTPGN